VQAQALRRAVDNLVENAWRHGAAPVVLRTGRADNAGPQSDGVWIEVQDHGPGVPAAELERIRQPFARGEAARSGRPGAGLGLAIADRVARAHGGRLELHSTPGQGLRARLVLPAH
jgi:two-component system osmolarity sensor histidine kinase EnvZ